MKKYVPLFFVLLVFASCGKEKRTLSQEDVEQAILARAERLAAEYRERAQRSRDSILREAAERLARTC